MSICDFYPGTPNIKIQQPNVINEPLITLGCWMLI